ncbi:MAG TPA: choice-of-anchor B family protein [Bacteroidia bacterium]|jgi:choice-of-anchor B domain-containing protein|nr:choice-of-anchor B family protein [Bacteroidia bacterium]
MKKVLLALIILHAPFSILHSQSENYNTMNVSKIGHWWNPAQQPEPTYGIKYQAVWGWYQQNTNREYAIIGTSTGTEFIDVTNPASPVVCDYIPATHGNLIWHEIKNYQNYCYIVSDDAAPNSFIIADMSYLPDSVHVVRNDRTIFERCHTIYVDGDKLYGGSVTGINNSFFYSMAVYDLSADPTTPTLIRHLDQDYATPGTVHDMFVRNDTVYASGGYDGLFIYKFNDGTTNTFSELDALQNYPEQGYNHSSFLTQNGQTLIFTDEVPAGKGIKSLDVSQFGNLTMNQVFRSNTGNTPHNPYIIGNDILVMANYTDGVQIFDISNPSNVVRCGYFDDDTTINYPNYTQAYHGCWGAYTDLPSGNLLAADMQNGLYILDISQAELLNTNNAVASAVSLDAFPNPFDASCFLNLTLDKTQTITYTIYDAEGKFVKTKTQEMPAGKTLLEIESADLAAGIYSVQVKGETINAVSRLVKK